MMKQPHLSPVPGKGQYCLIDDYCADYGDIKIIVPAFFLFDGASIPPIGWRLTYTPFHPDVMAPALVHDWLYVNHQVARDIADNIFYDFLVLNGANKKKSKFMYWAVDKFAGGHWKLSKEDKKKLLLIYIRCKESSKFDLYHFPVDVLTG